MITLALGFSILVFTCAAVETTHGIKKSVENGGTECGPPVLHTAHTAPLVFHRVVRVHRPHAQRAVKASDGVHHATHVHYAYTRTQTHVRIVEETKWCENREIHRESEIFKKLSEAFSSC